MIRLLGVPILVFLAAGWTSVMAADFEITQKNQAFSMASLNVKVGDSVTFKNEDKVNHSVYSVSDAKAFDLGSEAPGKAQKIVFDKAGTVEVECAMHDSMRVKITVAP
ncbi:MAG: cupredoxin domain-containing protein [Burkholderiaceae bacterium]|jgi:plastocyanin